MNGPLHEAWMCLTACSQIPKRMFYALLINPLSVNYAGKRVIIFLKTKDQN
jgi:hypothetical protein